MIKYEWHLKMRTTRILRGYLSQIIIEIYKHLKRGANPNDNPLPAASSPIVGL